MSHSVIYTTDDGATKRDEKATVNQPLTVHKDHTLEKSSVVAKFATTAALDQQAKKESRKK
jgi:hypothetical protein